MADTGVPWTDTTARAAAASLGAKVRFFKKQKSWGWEGSTPPGNLCNLGSEAENTYLGASGIHTVGLKLNRVGRKIASTHQLTKKWCRVPASRALSHTEGAMHVRLERSALHTPQHPAADGSC